MKEDKKIPCIYTGVDPNQAGVTHVIIQTQTTPPYVFAMYGAEQRLIQRLPDDLVAMPLVAAKNLFEFQKGKLEDCILD